MITPSRGAEPTPGSPWFAPGNRESLELLARFPFVCPTTNLGLNPSRIEAADATLDGDAFVSRKSGSSPAVGRTSTVLLRSDHLCAYPVVDGIPILLSTERLVPADALDNEIFDLAGPKYAEAYVEMPFYNQGALAELDDADHSPMVELLQCPLALTPGQRAAFPDPTAVWLDAIFDSLAQEDVYRHLSPIQGRSAMQIGGKGLHALKFLLAGAAEAHVVSPMLGEVLLARAVAERIGLEDRIVCVVAVAEELPYADAVLDSIYAGGCAHHMVTDVAFPELRRVLRPDGRFGAVEPWRAPLYSLGTRLLGKREDAYCRPLDRARVRPLFTSFSAGAVIHHGALTRYALLALAKFGLNLSVSRVSRIVRWDDRLCSMVPGLRRLGSSVALLATA